MRGAKLCPRTEYLVSIARLTYRGHKVFSPSVGDKIYPRLRVKGSDGKVTYKVVVVKVLTVGLLVILIRLSRVVRVHRVPVPSSSRLAIALDFIYLKTYHSTYPSSELTLL